MHLIPNTGAIDFFGEIFVIDWGPTNSDGELHVMRYRNRTTSRKPIEINQRKVIHLPARIQRGSVVTHGCKVKEEYTMYDCILQYFCFILISFVCDSNWRII